jgi:hypothetical protein
MRALASDSLVKNESEQGYVMAQHDADQVADRNGQSGERWVAHQARLDARLAVASWAGQRDQMRVYSPAVSVSESRELVSWPIGQGTQKRWVLT